MHGWLIKLLNAYVKRQRYALHHAKLIIAILRNQRPVDIVAVNFRFERVDYMQEDAGYMYMMI